MYYFEVLLRMYALRQASVAPQKKARTVREILVVVEGGGGG